MFPHLAKTLSLAFKGHCLREVFQSLHDYNLALGLPIYTRLDDLWVNDEISMMTR